MILAIVEKWVKGNKTALNLLIISNLFQTQQSFSHKSTPMAFSRAKHPNFPPFNFISSINKQDDLNIKNHFKI